MNYQLILDRALESKVDMIVHGGDVFYRSKVSSTIIDKVYEPLLEVANQGIPVYIVPGNHERSKLPEHLWLSHEGIHVFDRPKTYLREVRGIRLALSGFPFARKVKERFWDLLDQTDYLHNSADLHLLCLHQTFEGAQVGPNDFTFRRSPDNIPTQWIPRQFSAVLSGHIHRAQNIKNSLDQKQSTVPVIYPGSIERTSFAEREEKKYYVMITIHPIHRKDKLVTKYHQLPTRPMIKTVIDVQNCDLEKIKPIIKNQLSTFDPHAVVRIKLSGSGADDLREKLSDSHLRALGPATMNMSLERDWINSRPKS